MASSRVWAGWCNSGARFGLQVRGEMCNSETPHGRAETFVISKLWYVFAYIFLFQLFQLPSYLIIASYLVPDFFFAKIYRRHFIVKISEQKKHFYQYITYGFCVHIYIYLKIDIRRHRHKCKLDIQGFISLSLLDSWLGYVVSDIEVLREWRWQIWVLNHCLYTPTTWKSKLSKQRHLLGWNGSPQNFRILAWNQSIFISNFFWDSAGDPIEYDGPRDADGIAEWLRSFGQQWRRVETMIKEKKEKNSRIMGRPSPN